MEDPELKQLTSVVSHDLKAPLRTISAFSGRVLERSADRLDAASREDLERVVQAAGRMQRMLDDLLDYARLESGETFGPVELGPLVEAVLRDLGGPIAEAEARVQVGPLPLVWGNTTTLSQLFQNLISNAIKFRGPETPLVAIAGQVSDDRVLVSVADNGIGIDSEHHDRIFGVFKRLHTREEYEGTGIGLSVCRRIAEAHGSALRVESRPGAGARFCFSLATGEPVATPLSLPE